MAKRRQRTKNEYSDANRSRNQRWLNSVSITKRMKTAHTGMRADTAHVLLSNGRTVERRLFSILCRDRVASPLLIRSLCGVVQAGNIPDSGFPAIDDTCE